VADVGFDAVRELIRSGRRGAVVTVIDGDGLGAKLLVTSDEVVGSLGDAELDARAAALARELIGGEESGVREAAGRALFVDVHTPQPHLLVIGAVDFTAALARLARIAGFRVTVVDARTHFATAERIPDAHEIIVAWPHDYLAEHPPDDSTYVAVLTHEPRFDDPTLTAVLASPAPYVGAMGSRRAHAERVERLLAAGVPAEQLARVSAPIGLDLGAATTEETAISILAEIVAARHGRSGGRLSERKRPVHELTEREHLSAAEADAHTPGLASAEANSPERT
jgi:xanthine dehydrogenase accessory factor